MSQGNTTVMVQHNGLGIPVNEKANPESPSQASILLERINARARARKAAQINKANEPMQSTPIKLEAGRKDESRQNIEEGIDSFLRQMRNSSFGNENVVEDKAEVKKKIKKKDKDTDDELNLTVNGEADAHSEETSAKRKRKDKSNDSQISSENVETKTYNESVGKSPKKNKKQSNYIQESVGKEDKTNTSLENQIVACDSENATPKLKKNKHTDNSHLGNDIIDSSVVDDIVVKSSPKKTKKIKKEKSNDNSYDDEANTSLTFDLNSKVKLSKKEKKVKIENEMTQNFVNSEPVDENLSYDLELDNRKSKKKKKQAIVCAWGEEDLVKDTSREEDSAVKAKKIKKQSQDFQVEDVNGEVTVRAIKDTALSEDAQEDDFRNETPGKKKKKKRKKNEDTIIPDTPDIASSSGSKVDNGPSHEGQASQELQKRKKQKKVGFTEETVTKEGVLNTSEENLKPRAMTKTEKNRQARERRKKAAAFAKQKRKEAKAGNSKETNVGNSKKTKVGDFTLIGEVRSAHKKKLGRTLPHWLAHPTVVGRDLQEGSVGLEAMPGLAEWLRKALEQNGISQFFPIQSAVIPELLISAGPLALRFRPRDICVSAPTGSGKTLAYVLPILQALKGRTVPRIRALVLLPVQELAIQVHKVFQTYSRGSGLKIGLAVGQKSFKKEQVGLMGSDYRGHHCLVDILVATPGRLTDHLTLTPGLDLSTLRYLVLDEADRMLAAEGGEWVSRIEQAVGTRDSNGLTCTSHPPHRLLFSATLSHDPELLQSVTLHHPRLFTVTGSTLLSSTDMITGQYVRPAELIEEYVVVDEPVKPLVLHHLISGRTSQEEDIDVKGESSNEAWQKVLVFTNSRAATHRLAILLALLAPHRRVAEFSSSAGKKEKRQHIVSQFAAGKIDVLVSSDAMARGLDIPDIEHVVSYDVTSANTYVHRIGRTARAGQPGTALSLVTKPMLPEFKRGLRKGGEAAREVRVSVEELEPYEAQYVDALAKMKEKLQEEEQQRREKLAAAAKKRKSSKWGVTEQ